jgi:hypothetical protein
LTGRAGDAEAEWALDIDDGGDTRANLPDSATAPVVAEAPLERTEHGLMPAGDGWFVLNARSGVADLAGPRQVAAPRRRSRGSANAGSA